MRPIRDIVMSEALVQQGQAISKILLEHEKAVSKAIVRAEVRGILRFCASIRHRVTYVSLAKSLQMFSGGTELASILGDIMVEDFQAGHPILSSLVVKTSTGIPGGGYFNYAKKIGLQGHREPDVHFWRNQMAAFSSWGSVGATSIVIGKLPYDPSTPFTSDEKFFSQAFTGEYERHASDAEISHIEESLSSGEQVSKVDNVGRNGSSNVEKVEA